MGGVPELVLDTSHLLANPPGGGAAGPERLERHSVHHLVIVKL